MTEKKQRLRPLPCAFKSGWEREPCGGAPELINVRLGARDNLYCRCKTCRSITGRGDSEEGALREWNRWMEMESR